jgi:putative phage-type endonuclease
MENPNRDENKDAWLKSRLNTIGSSQIATVLGLNGYESKLALWHRYVNQDLSIPDNEFMFFGREVEPIIIKLFERQTGHVVTPNNDTYTMDGSEFAACTPDGFYEEDGEPNILECKSSTGNFELWKNGKLPDYVACQVHWQMGITGIRKCTVACLLGGHPDLIKIPVEFDVDTFQVMLLEAESFLEMVREVIQPKAGYLDMNLLEEMNPTEKGKEIDLNDIELSQKAERLMAIKHEKAEVDKQSRAFDKEKKGIEAEIKQQMGDANIAHFPINDLTFTATPVNVKEQYRDAYSYVRCSIK